MLDLEVNWLTLLLEGQREKIIQLGKEVLQQVAAFSHPEIA